MKLSKFTLAIIAVAGALALSQSSRAQTNTPPAGGRQQGGRAMSVDTQMTRLNEQLKLTDDQKTKVKALLEDQTKKRQELRNATPEERRTKAQAMRADQTKQMKEILTAEQFKKYEQQQQQQRGQGNNRRQQNGNAGGAAPAGAAGAGGQGQQ